MQEVKRVKNKSQIISLICGTEAQNQREWAVSMMASPWPWTTKLRLPASEWNWKVCRDGLDVTGLGPFAVQTVQ